MTLQEQYNQQVELGKFHTAAAQTFNNNIEKIDRLIVSIDQFEDLKADNISLQEVIYFAQNLYVGLASYPSNQEASLFSHYSKVRNIVTFAPEAIQYERGIAQIKLETMPDSTARKTYRR